MYSSGYDVGALVADIGSFASRIGYAGDDCPRAYFPTAVGVNRGAEASSSSVASGSKKSCHFDIVNFKEDLAIESPITDGQITDWDLLESIWDHALSNYLKVELKESPILLTEKPYNPPYARQRMAEMMMEKFNAPAMFLSKDAVLECYACGRTTGLVVDVGANCTMLTPVLDGYVETKGLNRNIYGGRLADTLAVNVIRKYAAMGSNALGSNRPTSALPQFRVAKTVGLDNTVFARLSGVKNVHPTYDSFMLLEMGRNFKEASCRVAESPLIDTDPRFANLPTTPYELPDGTILDVGVERFQLTEMLFDPSSVDLDCSDMASLGYTTLASSSSSRGPDNRDKPAVSTEGVGRLVSNSILRCDPDNNVQTTLCGNVVVAGGASAVEGLPERVKLDVETVVHALAPGLRIKTVSLNLSERALTAWLGGSIVASLGSFHEMWLSRQEYEEFGPGIVEKKCP